MDNPYQSPRSNSNAPLPARRTHLAVLMAFAISVIMVSWCTRGMPYFTVVLIACSGFVALFFVAQAEQRRFVWFGVGALVGGLSATWGYITYKCGVADSYESLTRIANAFESLAAITIPTSVIVGTTLGIITARGRRDVRLSADLDDDSA